MTTTITLTLSLYTTIPLLLLLLLSFSTTSLADVVPSPTLLAPDSVCNATVDPKYCKTVLPRTGRRTIYDYTKSMVGQSLRSAQRFSTVIDRYLKTRASLSNSAIRALEDCKLMAELNIDYLQSSSRTIDSTQTLKTLQTDDLQTVFSSVLTNQQTCFEGIQGTASSWSLKNGLETPLSNGSKLYSVSLALFTRGYRRKQQTKRKVSLGRKLLFSNLEHGRHGRLPLKMSSEHRRLYETVSGRTLLQAPDSIAVRDIVVVNPDGSGNFTTINEAIAVAPNSTDISGGYFVIYVAAGVYEENVVVDKKKRNIMMIGDGIDQTVITGNRSVIDGWTTFNSATLAVVGQGFVGLNFTVRNTAGAIKHQAVALRNGADLSTFYSCSFEAYQDTLYTHSNRQFYRECDVYGTVDFIFGNAAVVLQNCNIIARLPMSGQFNAITAQGRTDPNQNTGTSIQNCVITAAPELTASTGTTRTYLGRPWKEFSRTVYVQSFMDSLIEPAGWREWNGEFALSTLYYAEYDNTGPGSSTESRVTWPGYNVLSAENATDFTVSNFILGDNWVPATGVPYDSGL